MQAEKMKPQEQVTLEPYERDHAVVVGIYRPPPKVKAWMPCYQGIHWKATLHFQH